MSTADLAAYTPETREALCAPYRDKIVCGMPPSSSGGVTVMETLGILNNFDLAQYPPTEVGLDGGLPNAEAVHLISEAERLAYADRDAYIGDPAFVEVPAGGVEELISDVYTGERSELIDPEHSMGQATAGLSQDEQGRAVQDLQPLPLSKYLPFLPSRMRQVVVADHLLDFEGVHLHLSKHGVSVKSPDGRQDADSPTTIA